MKVPEGIGNCPERTVGCRTRGGGLGKRTTRESGRIRWLVTHSSRPGETCHGGKKRTSGRSQGGGTDKHMAKGGKDLGSKPHLKFFEK